MIIFLDSSGNIVSASSPEKIGRNSNDASLIYVVAPFSSAAQIYMTFKLPSGETMFGDVLERVGKGEEITEEMQAAYLFDVADKSLSVWRYKVPSSVTRLAGNVEYTIVIVTESMRQTASGSFTVSKGNKLTLPDTPTPEVWDNVLTEINSLSEDISDLSEDVGETEKKLEDIRSDIKNVGYLFANKADDDGYIRLDIFDAEDNRYSESSYIDLKLEPQVNDDGNISVAIKCRYKNNYGTVEDVLDTVSTSYAPIVAKAEEYADAMSITATMDEEYKLRLQLVGGNGQNLGKAVEVDFPSEYAFVDAKISDDKTGVVFTLQNGNTVTVPIDQIAGKFNISQEFGDGEDVVVSQKAISQVISTLVTILGQLSELSVQEEDFEVRSDAPVYHNSRADEVCLIMGKKTGYVADFKHKALIGFSDKTITTPAGSSITATKTGDYEISLTGSIAPGDRIDFSGLSVDDEEYYRVRKKIMLEVYAKNNNYSEFAIGLFYKDNEKTYIAEGSQTFIPYTKGTEIIGTSKAAYDGFYLVNPLSYKAEFSGVNLTVKAATAPNSWWKGGENTREVGIYVAGNKLDYGISDEDSFASVRTISFRSGILAKDEQGNVCFADMDVYAGIKNRVVVKQETGDSDEAVMSQKAVKYALSKKAAISEKALSGNKVLLYKSGVPDAINYSATPTAGTVACWGNNESGKDKPTSSLGYMCTCDPVNPYHAANKKFVEYEDAKLSNRIADLEGKIGAIIKTETVQSGAEGIDLPEGVLPNIYIEKAWVIANEWNWETGDLLNQIEANATKVNFLGEGMVNLGWADISVPCYVSIPEGTKFLTFNWDDVVGNYTPAGFDIVVTVQVLKAGE